MQLSLIQFAHQIPQSKIKSIIKKEKRPLLFLKKTNKKIILTNGQKQQKWTKDNTTVGDLWTQPKELIIQILNVKHNAVTGTGGRTEAKVVGNP